MKVFTQTKSGYRLTTEKTINILTHKDEYVTSVWKGDSRITKVVNGKITKFKDYYIDCYSVTETEYPNGAKRIIDYGRGEIIDTNVFGNSRISPIGGRYVSNV